MRIQRKPSYRGDRDRYAVMPLEPRDPDVLRAKQLIDRGTTDRSSRARRRA